LHHLDREGIMQVEKIEQNHGNNAPVHS